GDLRDVTARGVDVLAQRVLEREQALRGLEARCEVGVSWRGARGLRRRCSDRREVRVRDRRFGVTRIARRRVRERALSLRILILLLFLFLFLFRPRLAGRFGQSFPETFPESFVEWIP